MKLTDLDVVQRGESQLAKIRLLSADECRHVAGGNTPILRPGDGDDAIRGGPGADVYPTAASFPWVDSSGVGSPLFDSYLVVDG